MKLTTNTQRFQLLYGLAESLRNRAGELRDIVGGYEEGDCPDQESLDSLANMLVDDAATVAAVIEDMEFIEDEEEEK